MEEHTQDENWKDWIGRHGPRLFLYARQLTRSASDAEDVLQEAFVRFWKSQRALPGEPLPRLFISIRRAAIDLGRREDRRLRREERYEADAEPSWFDPREADRARAGELECALRDLSPEQREVVVLKVWGELTFEQIGNQLQISPNTAASRYRQGLTVMRRQLVANLP